MVTATQAPPRARKTRKPLPPATGTCRWIDGKTLQITTITPAGDKVTHLYEIEFLSHGWALYRFLDPKEIKGEGWDRKTTVRYEVKTTATPGVWTCTCPDAEHGRQYVCKHVRAVRAALAKLPL